MKNAQTIQGLNLESRFTTVKISLPGEYIDEISKLVEKISSFHPIFLEEYTLSPSMLVVRSKLPFLWRESADSFAKLSTRDISYDEAYSYVVDTVIAKRIKSMSTIPILFSAHKHNIETIPVLEDIMLRDFNDGYRGVFNRYFVIGCGNGSQITGSISSTKDAYLAQNIQRDKWSTNTVIEKLNLPMPKWQTVHSLSELESVWGDYDKPVVIKPTGLTGGHGVVVGINTLDEAKRAYKFAKEATQDKPRGEWQKKIMIQEQVEGEDYRLLVIDGELEIATKRIPAFVIGDGDHTIEELVEITNQDPRREISNPAHILKPIKIDEPLKDCIKEQGYTLSSIPSQDVVVKVRKVASMSQGGITEDFTDLVSDEIKLIVETIAKSTHAFVLGVDVMCKDISKPLTKDNGAILEINTMPESYLNFFPVIGKQRDYVADIYIKKLIKESSTKKYVVIGQTIDDIPTLLRRNIFNRNQDMIIGEVKNGSYYINGKEINEGLEHWKAVDAIKCNALLDTIILHFRDWKDVEEKGLGFDHIHTVYVTKDMKNNSECMKIIRRYKRAKLINSIKIL